MVRSPPRTLASRGAKNGNWVKLPALTFRCRLHKKLVGLPKILMLCTVSVGAPYVAAFTPLSPTLPPTDLARAFLAAPDLDLVLTMNAPVIHDVLLRRASDHAEQPAQSSTLLAATLKMYLPARRRQTVSTSDWAAASRQFGSSCALD